MQLTQQERDSLMWRHRFAAGVHFSAFLFLLFYAGVDNLKKYKDTYWVNFDKWGFEPRRWLYNCYDADGNQMNTRSCSDKQKRFYVETPEGDSIGQINLIGASCFYVLWSAADHAIAQKYVEKTAMLRWIDYCGSAPTMLIVLSLTFGADSSTAIIIAPLLLFVLLVLGAYCEPAEQPILKDSAEARVTYEKSVIIGIIFVAYIFVIFPSLYASGRIVKERTDSNLPANTGVGTAPWYVLVFCVIIIVSFTTFAINYLYDLLRKPSAKRYYREHWYIYLSMISKTLLHLFIGLSVINQSRSLGVDSPPPKSTDMETLRNGLIGAGAVLTVLSIITYIISKRVPAYTPGNNEMKQKLLGGE